MDFFLRFSWADFMKIYPKTKTNTTPTNIFRNTQVAYLYFTSFDRMVFPVDQLFLLLHLDLLYRHLLFDSQWHKQ